VADIGDTFLILTGPRPHLHIIVWGPGPIPVAGPGNQFILVSIATVVPLHDPACELQKGEHKFVQHASYIYYRAPKIATESQIASMVQNGYWTPHLPASAQLVTKIRSGFCASATVAKRVQQLLGCPNPPPPPP
jgi:hypothetical protein